MMNGILFFQNRQLTICERSYRSYSSENRPLNVYNIFQNYRKKPQMFNQPIFWTRLGIKERNCIPENSQLAPHSSRPSEVSYCDKCKKCPRIGTCTHIYLNKNNKQYLSISSPSLLPNHRSDTFYSSCRLVFSNYPICCMFLNIEKAKILLY